MKKSKKSKKLQTVPLSRFLADTSDTHSFNDDSRQQQKPTLKYMRSTAAMECCEPNGWQSVKPNLAVKASAATLIELPTAPRANRLLDNDASIPHRPPYVAFINNLPFDAHEDEVRTMFQNLHIQSLRLPREDRYSKRSRGFAYLEFNTREELISLLRMEEPMLRGRRVRIEVSNDHEGYYMRCGNDTGVIGDDWRTQVSPNLNTQLARPQAGGDNGNSNYVSDITATDNNGKSNKFAGFAGEPSAEYDCYMGGNYCDFDKEFPILNRPQRVNLTTTSTTATTSTSSPTFDQSHGSSSSSSVEQIFGMAKPVDTAAKERQIQERLDHERFAQQRLQQLANFENSMTPNQQNIFGDIRPPKLHFFRNI